MGIACGGNGGFGECEEKRKTYTLDQVKKFLCLAHFRKLHPGAKGTILKLNQFFEENEWLFELVLQAYLKGESSPKCNPPPKRFKLSELYAICCNISNSKIARTTWSRWKKHLKIEKRSHSVEQARGALLVYIAKFRADNPRACLPSVTKLKYLAREAYEPQFKLEHVTSYKQQRIWDTKGCSGKDLLTYLNSWGIKVSQPTLYRSKLYSRKKFYTPNELRKIRCFLVDKYGHQN